MRSNDDSNLRDLISQLLRVVPEFSADREYVQDGITYLVFDELVDFVFKLNPDTSAAVISRVFAFLEQLSSSREKEVQMLLRDVAWAIASKPELQQFEGFIGPRIMNMVRESPAFPRHRSPLR